MKKPARKSFHHGNVEADATKIGLELLKSVGHEALSVRQVAERVGVAHRAISSRFGDKNGLLNAIATAGYNQLADYVSSADSADDFTERYIMFGVENPNLYALMTSRPHATMSDFPALQTAVHRVITEAMSYFGSPSADPEDNRRAVMRAYIILHGGLTLSQSGVLDIASNEALIDELRQMLA